MRLRRMTASADVLEALRRSPAQKVKVAITDIDGVLRGKYLHKDKFLSAAEGGGFGFCNVVFGWDSGDVCYDNADVHRLAHGLSRRAGARRPRHHAHACPGTATCPFFLADFVDGRRRAARASARASC